MMIRLLLSLFLIISASSAWAEKILDLGVLSERTKKDLEVQIPSLATKQFTKADLDLLIRALITQQQYDDVQILSQTRGNQEIYILTVGKTKRISALTFQNDSIFSESEIRREFNLSEKANFDRQSLIEAGERLRQFFLSQGYPQTKIELEYTQVTPVDVAVSINIVEGPRTLIKEITLETSNDELRTNLRRALRGLIDEPLTEPNLAEIRKRAREFFSKKNYLSADLVGPQTKLNAEETEANLIFRVIRPESYTVEIEGNEKINRSEARSAMDLENFFSANPNIGSELSNRVKTHYLKGGYARVEVESSDIERVGPFSRRVLIRIKEGPRVRLKEVQFTGRFTQPAKDYVDFVKRHSSDLIESGFYNRDDFESGLRNLIVSRQNEGHLRARIMSSRTVYNDRKDAVTILVNLDEGPVTILDDIRFEGNTAVPAPILLDVFGIRAAEPLRLNALEESLTRLKNFYHSSGYLEMMIENEKDPLVYNEDNSHASLTYKFREGPLVNVGSILIEGNSLTRDSVILKELDFKVGDILTPAKIEESIGRLQRLGHFSTVDIKTLEERTQIAKRTVVVRVADREPGLFQFGAGVSNERNLTLRGYAGIKYQNILGTGRAVSARLDGSYNVADRKTDKILERKITLGYIEPYLFDSRIRGQIDRTSSVSVNISDERMASEVNQTTTSLSQYLTSHILLVYEVLSLATVRDYPISTDLQLQNPSLPADPVTNPVLKVTETNIASTGPTIDFDYRDNAFNPSKGTFTRLNLEYAAPWLGSSETIEYLRTQASFTHYWTIGKPGWVWANSIRGGYLQNLANTDSTGYGVPYDKKGFLLGGQSTIRGYLPEEAFPSPQDDLGNANYLLKTSATMGLIKTELRFPIYGNIGGAVFYDGGFVTIRGVPNDDPYHDSAGFGMRYITPVGAASIEFAHKLDKKAGSKDNDYAFHFYIGTF